MEEIQQSEKPDSVTLKENTKGEVAFDVKIYFNKDKETNDDVVARLDNLVTKIRNKYKR